MSRYKDYFGDNSVPAQGTIRNILGQNKEKKIKNSTYKYVNNVFSILKRINKPTSNDWSRRASIVFSDGTSIPDDSLVYIRLYQHLQLAGLSITEVAAQTEIGSANIEAMLDGEPIASDIVKAVFDFLKAKVPAEGPHQPMNETEYLID